MPSPGSFAVLAFVLATACGGEAPMAPVSDDVPPAPDQAAPAGLIGMWTADGSAVRETALRMLLRSHGVDELPPTDRAAKRTEIETQVEGFAKAWSMKLTLRADWTFTYRLTQLAIPTYLRAGVWRLAGRQLTLWVQEVRDEHGRPAEDLWSAAWRKHSVRWDEKLLRFQAVGRQDFEFVLHKE